MYCFLAFSIGPEYARRKRKPSAAASAAALSLSAAGVIPTYHHCIMFLPFTRLKKKLFYLPTHTCWCFLSISYTQSTYCSHFCLIWVQFERCIPPCVCPPCKFSSRSTSSIYWQSSLKYTKLISRFILYFRRMN